MVSSFELGGVKVTGMPCGCLPDLRLNWEGLRSLGLQRRGSYPAEG